MANTKSKSNRKQAAKNVAKAVGKQYTDTLPSMTKTATYALDSVNDLSKGNIVGAVANAGKAVVQGAKTVGKAVKHGWEGLKNAYKTIFNDPKWWTRTGIQPSMNVTRPMNPIFNLSITNDPTIGSVLKVADLYLNWTGLFESEMFNTIVIKYYEAIRNSVRSNLPYDQQTVKEYLINAIAIKAVAAQCKRNLAFRNFSPSESPNSYKLFRKKAASIGGYGAVKLDDINYLQDEVIAISIVEWDTAVDIISNVVLPPYINDFIDHYFGLVFSSDSNNTNSQYIVPQLYNVDYYNKSLESVVSLNVNGITPTNLIEMLNNLLSNYGMVIADLKHSGMTLVSCTEPKYSQLDTTVYYDKSMLQAICNAYTSYSALENNFVRLDSMGDSGDLFTSFIMMGAIQQMVAASALNLPLLTPICMSLKVENTPELDWEDTFTQSDMDLSTYDFFAINMITDIEEDVYVSYTSAGTTTTINQSGTNKSGQDYTNLKVKTNITTTTYSPPTVSNDIQNLVEILNSKETTIYCKIPLFYISVPGLASNSIQMVAAVLTCTKSTRDGDYYFTHFNYSHVTCEYYNSVDDCLNAYRSASQFMCPRLSVTKPTESGYTGAGFITCEASDYIQVKNLPAIGWLAGANLNCRISGLVSRIFNPTITIPNNHSYSFQVIYTNILSIIDVSATVTAEVSEAVSVSSGYLGMSEWLVQQLDFHIPLLVKHRYTTNIDGKSKTYVSGTNLLKEAYIPFWYNINDILPVAYAMMNSLLSPMFENRHTR